MNQHIMNEDENVNTTSDTEAPTSEEVSGTGPIEETTPEVAPNTPDEGDKEASGAGAENEAPVAA